MRLALIIFLLPCWSTSAFAESGSAAEPDLPSADLLEFLGDLEPLDDETWDLLEHHALRDAAQRKQGESQ